MQDLTPGTIKDSKSDFKQEMEQVKVPTPAEADNAVNTVLLYRNFWFFLCNLQSVIRKNQCCTSQKKNDLLFLLGVNKFTPTFFLNIYYFIFRKLS